MIPAMIPSLIEAAVRGLLLAAVVWAGLRALRVRNVVAQKATWGLVLAAALAIPAAMYWRTMLPATVVVPVETWQRATRLLPSPKEATLPPPAPVARSRRSEPEFIELPAVTAPSAALAGQGRFPAPAISNVEAAERSDVSPLAVSPAKRLSDWLLSFSLLEVVRAIYLLVCALLLIRLFYGAARAMLLWWSARPVQPDLLPAWCAATVQGLPLRSTTAIKSPLTIGSGVLLPEDYPEWDVSKLRVVLAHERSHVRQGDFYLQLLAGIYAAIFWFSPLGWWLRHTLSDLSETISDRAGLREAASRSSYAQVLLEFAVAPRSTYEGVAMAREGNLSQRIEKLLNESSFRQAFAGSRGRMLAAVLLVPTALVGATAMVRVEAAAKAAPEPVATVQAAEPAQATVTATQTVAVYGSTAAAPSAEVVPGSVALEGTGPMTLALAMPAVNPRIVAVPAAAAYGKGDRTPDATFERTLNVSGQAQLSVATGSGDIRISKSSGNQVHILAKINVSHDGSVEEARQIAANPPIEQNGNSIMVGGHNQHWHGISIDYTIEAPADTQLLLTTGSGDISDDGVGRASKITTGSGDVKAAGLSGGFQIQTGSGDIQIGDIGEGDAKVQTGSGNIEVKSVRGALMAQTGSGDIKASGTPSSAWRLGTGSGSIDFWAGSAGFTLDASTGSGDITSEHGMMMQGNLNKHHITATVNGGGPTVRAETGSGDIRVH